VLNPRNAGTKSTASTCAKLTQPTRRASSRGRVDHLVLPCDDRGQDLGLLALPDIEVVKRARDLRSDLVELLGGDVEILVGFSEVRSFASRSPVSHRNRAKRLPLLAW